MFLVFRRHFKINLIIAFSLVVIYLLSYAYFYGILKVSKSICMYQKDFFIISSYVVHNFPFKDEQRKIIESIESYNDIREKYRCETLGPLFWGGRMDWSNLFKYRHEVRRILLYAISKDIKPFLDNIICSSLYIYYPKYPTNSLFIFDPKRDNYIFDEVPKAKLYRDMKLPQIQSIIERILDYLLSSSKSLFKPSTYLYLAIIIFIFFANLRPILIPSLLNVIPLIFMSPGPELRFLLSIYFASLFCLILIINQKITKSENKL